MKKEYIGYVIAILSLLIGALISWYFYEKSQELREPLWSIDHFPSVFMSSQSRSNFPLKVINLNDEIITEDIFIAAHTFWNRGKKPIFQSDVLEPIVLNFDKDNFDLLHFYVRKQSRSVVSCALSSSESNKLRLDFIVMEQMDGCSIVIVYTGKRYPSIVASGVIVGVSTIKVLSVDLASEMRLRIDSVSSFFEGLIPLYLFVFLCWFFLFYSKNPYNYSAQSKPRFYFLYVILVGAIASSAYVLSKTYIEDRYIPLPETPEWSTRLSTSSELNLTTSD